MNKEIKTLKIDELIWIIFIIISILNIYKDKKQETNINYSGKDISILSISITILIYSYFTYLNYQNLNKKEDRIRLLGTLFLLIGSICLLYFQINNQENINTNPEVL